MYAFEYHRPKTVADAVSLLQGASDGRFLAGGHTLLPTLKQRLAQPSDLIDLGAIAELKGIRQEGDRLVIGATTPHAEVAASEAVRSTIPALAHLAEHIGDAQVRNRGTIGGSIANNDPAADYPAAIVGLNASVKTNKREIGADDFFTGMFDTALADDEIILSVSFPKLKRAGYAKFPNPASRYAIVGVMVAQTASGVRVAVTGAGPCVFRLPDFEQALGGNFSADAIKGLSVSADGLNSDIHASAEYRAHLVKVMTVRACDALVRNG
jgi:carbon-monoxide dehydrogenase medium subunit